MENTFLTKSIKFFWSIFSNFEENGNFPGTGNSPGMSRIPREY